MTQKFAEFAGMIDEKCYETVREFLAESVTMVGVLEKGAVGK